MCNIRWQSHTTCLKRNLNEKKKKKVGRSTPASKLYRRRRPFVEWNKVSWILSSEKKKKSLLTKLFFYDVMSTKLKICILRELTKKSPVQFHGYSISAAINTVNRKRWLTCLVCALWNPCHFSILHKTLWELQGYKVEPPAQASR